MKLTVAEVGVDQYRKAERDRAWFGYQATAAARHASERGAMAYEQITYATTPDALGNEQPAHHFDRFVRDAMMFAQSAFRGWRAYRLMVGE